MEQDKSIIYYSNGIVEPIKSMVLDSIKVGLPVIKSVSNGNTYHDMIDQIVYCLEQVKTKYVFFCEHDVIFNPTHFDFTPEKDDIFYYNSHVWRWNYPHDRYITYDRLISLSGLCANTELALNHFKARQKYIKKFEPRGGEPDWLRKMGYEPGTKSKRRGGVFGGDFDTWKSEKPLIDIRHSRTFSPRKVGLDAFKHLPTGWKETHERP
jgi:hypothetical protein